jgi:hypothetical protein
LTFRYSFADQSLFEPFTGPSFPLVPGYGDNVPTRDQNAMIAETHVFTPALLNEFRAGFDRVSEGVYQQDIGQNVNGQVGLPAISTNPRDFGLSSSRSPDSRRLATKTNNPQHGTTNVYQLNDNLTWVHGRHQAKFGVDYRILAAKRLPRHRVPRLHRLPGRHYRQCPRRAAAGLAHGFRRRHAQQPGASAHPQLQLFRQRHLARAPQSHADSGAALRIQLARRGRAESRQPVRSGDPDAGARGHRRHAARRLLPDRNNFAPRVGFAWTPSWSPRTVVRAGYGIYYDQSSLAPGEGLYFSPPYFNFNVYYPLSATAAAAALQPVPE